MSRRDLDNRMMSYLYDELPPQERVAFEEQLRTDEPLRRQVDELRATRLMLKRVQAPPAPPQALFDELLRESRRAAPAAAPASFWERFGALLMRPSTATAMLVVVVAFTGVWIVGTRDRSLHRGIQDTDQPALAPELPSREEVAAGRDEAKPALLPEPSPAAPPPAATATSAPAEPAGAPNDETVAAQEAPAATEAAADLPLEERDFRKSVSKKERVKTYPIQPPAVAPPKPTDDEGVSGLIADKLTTKGKGDRLDDERQEAKKVWAPEPLAKQAAEPRRIPEGQAKAPARELNYGQVGDDKRDNAPALAPEVEKAEFKKPEPAPVVTVQESERPSPAPGNGVAARVRRQEDPRPSQPSSLSQGAPTSLDGKEIVYRVAKPPPAATKTLNEEPSVAGETAEKAQKEDVAAKDKDADVVKSEKTGGTGELDRAMDHYKNQRYGQAIKDFQRFLDTNKGSGAAPDAQLNLARSLQRENQLKTAVESYRQHLSRYPGYRYRGAVLVETAQLEMRLGDLDAARKHLQDAVNDKSTSAKAKDLLAQLDKQLEEVARRRAASKKAAEKAAPAEKAKAATPAADEQKALPGKKAVIY